MCVKQQIHRWGQCQKLADGQEMKQMSQRGKKLKNAHPGHEQSSWEAKQNFFASVVH